MKLLRYMIVFCGLCWAFSAQAGNERDNDFAKWGPTSDHQGMGYLIRAGFVLGGTTPLPLPKEVRSINEFKPEGGFSIGIDGYKYFNTRWGLTAGLRFFMQGMHTGAEVKDYGMAITMGEDIVEGRFTGTDITETFMSGFTLPVMATFRASPRWSFNLGPYFSYWFYRDFDGSVFNGYLREGDPTGQKISISKENPATYDFSDHMRNFYWGMEFGFDCRIRKHLNVFGLVDWGLNGIFQNDFKTVSFTMFPLYATFGIAYYY